MRHGKIFSRSKQAKAVVTKAATLKKSQFTITQRKSPIDDHNLLQSGDEQCERQTYIAAQTDTE